MNSSIRLAELLTRIADIGRDPTSGGYRRFAYTQEDAQLREFFAATASRLGLAVSVDAAYNQWAWWGDPDRDPAQNLVLGSHLDSVPSGGALDGPLGVLSALVAVESLLDQGFQPKAAIGIVNFSDEEGARFGVACLGSRVLTGETSSEQLAQLRDYDGVPFDEVIARAGVAPLGRDDQTLARIGRFVELHIEQGHQLIELGAPLGLASFIWPHGRWSTVITGVPNHAGTTRLAERDDPLCKAARFILELTDLAITHDAIATCGKVVVDPNAVNAIAAAVHLWVDARAADPGVLDRLAGDITELAVGYGAHLVNESLTPKTTFSSSLNAAIGSLLGHPPVISTGAGHDAGILASHGVPAAMLFVRNPTGVSHAPNEAATREDMGLGVEALITTVRGLTT
ncbi:MAG: allantoate amidohydrolase [Ferrimicrobium sp.]|jgi:N-carbamoyl-L-amino-acid hydrolase|uniref:Allantoate amidohydrolase n=1 Tax=Ferrimicrobium acidiphilum TaxID=121039 RepID=A0ABV3Y1R5_9ACTN|nr:allantoate amidohydrolase [Ferrimicrobium sp.]